MDSDGPVLILSTTGNGHIFVRCQHSDMSTELQNFLVSTCEPVTRPHFFNQYAMTKVSLCAAASERVFTPAAIAQILLKFSGRDALPEYFEQLLRTMDLERRLQLVLEPVEDDNDGRNLTPAAAAALEAFYAAHPERRRQRGGGDDESSSSKQQQQNKQTPASSSGPTINDFGGRRLEFRQKKRLAYVLTSASQPLLDDLMSRSEIARHFQPVVIGGEAKLVYSDVVVQRTGEEISRENDDDDNDISSSGINAHHHVLYKAQLRAGSLRIVRELIFQRDGLTVDVSYDFARDVDITPSVGHFELRDPSVLRPYQEEAVRRFLGGSRARNGIVVLPCGAGKSLTGIACAAALRKPCIVLCVNELSVLQWQRQFLRWTTLKPEQITLYTGAYKDELPGDVFITTYAMLLSETWSSSGAGRKRKNPHEPNSAAAAAAAETVSENKRRKQVFMSAAKAKAWGALLLDEVHVAVADKYQQAFDQFNYHVGVGLTATLLREDDKIGNLRFLVGPKLFEANWLELARAGHLATVHCVEVRCPLPSPFLALYLGLEAPGGAAAAAAAAASGGGGWKARQQQDNQQQQQQQQVANNNNEQTPTYRASRRTRRERIEVMNPYKIWVVQALLAYHTAERSPADKVIIFCDSIVAIVYYARCLGVPFMTGETPQEEREAMIDHFENNPRFNVIMLTRVGDIALDIPAATVVIQLMGLGASRRQEAQRLGRVLRPKAASLFTANAFFYTVISTDTDEAIDAFSRQQWLRDQGFSYRVTTAETVMKHTEEHFAALAAKKQSGGGDNDEDDDYAESSSRMLQQPCPVPTDRWVCIAAQTGQFESQRGRPTMWQVRAPVAAPAAKTATAANSSTMIWRDLPPALCAVIEAAFVKGVGVLPHALGTKPGGADGAAALDPFAAAAAAAATASASAFSRVHVVIPAIRGCIVFDSIDIAHSNGVLYLFNSTAATMPSSLYPPEALESFVAPALTEQQARKAASAAKARDAKKIKQQHDEEQRTRAKKKNADDDSDDDGGKKKRKKADHHYEPVPSVHAAIGHLLVDVPGIAAPCVDLEAAVAKQLVMETLRVQSPAAFLALSVLEQEAMLGGKMKNSSSNGALDDDGADAVLGDPALQKLMLKQQKEQEQFDEEEPVTLSFRIRRFGDPAQHSCDINNPRSTCISALLTKIDSSVVDKLGMMH